MGLIFLVGMPGAGKTTVGALLAKELHYRFIDLDVEIVTRTRMTIPQMFAENGESVFREHESSSLARVCEESNAVIALGAGALVRHNNFEQVMSKGTLIYLRANLDLLVARNRGVRDRPLLKAADTDEELHAKLAELLERREARYLAATIIINERLCQSPRETLDMVLEAMRSRAQS